jgi:hypothetical protein
MARWGRACAGLSVLVVGAVWAAGAEDPGDFARTLLAMAQKSGGQLDQFSTSDERDAARRRLIDDVARLGRKTVAGRCVFDYVPDSGLWRVRPQWQEVHARDVLRANGDSPMWMGTLTSSGVVDEYIAQNKLGATRSIRRLTMNQVVFMVKGLRPDGRLATGIPPGPEFIAVPMVPAIARERKARMACSYEISPVYPFAVKFHEQSLPTPTDGNEIQSDIMAINAGFVSVSVYDRETGEIYKNQTLLSME